MKKGLKFVLMAVMALILSTAASASGFTDGGDSAYWAEAAGVLSDAGILTGYADGAFRGDAPITRAEMAAVICRMTGVGDDAEKARGKTGFSDVAASSWASGYINLAKEKGIVSGSNGLFRPGDNIKNEEALKMVVCALGLEDDVEAVPGDWSAGYFTVAADMNITDGLDLRKGAAATRADVACMVYHALYGGGMIRRDGFELDAWVDEGLTGIDYNTAYGSGYSYCIATDSRNAISLKKTFTVKPNTYYTASAYVKTENLLNPENGDIGANISYNGWTVSSTLLGDNDWTKLTLLTYSGGDTQMPVSFNYGFYQNTCTGKMYISQIELEEYQVPDSAEWNVLFVILPNSRITSAGGQGAGRTGTNGISSQEIADIQEAVRQFKADSYQDSGGKLNIKVETKIIDKPVTRLIETDNGLALGPEDAYELIKDDVSIDLYDHIFVFGNLNLPSTNVYALTFHPGFPQNTGYTIVNTQISDFSEKGVWRPALFIHEFLHGIESWCRMLNQEWPFELDHVEDVNAGGKYSNADEWRQYYIDLMNGDITLADGGKMGIPDSVWNITPKDFRFTRAVFHD